ncbi:(4Fe-4S)-binding protein [Streptomyces sp. NPDC059460]|uniref:(4Fe-4S)-binding protein n=1 Tax=Streptomyces sp. NPDC059460 TaxID=3346840 RepID=UPI003691626D
MQPKDFPPEGAKSYSGQGIRVSFEARRCLHAAECVKGLPAVFDPKTRPWIRLEGAGAEEIGRVIERCPSGALQFESDGMPPSPPQRTEVSPQAGGRLLVRGDVIVHTASGTRHETRMVLCGCGATGNTPYCDGSDRCARGVE